MGRLSHMSGVVVTFVIWCYLLIDYLSKSSSLISSNQKLKDETAHLKNHLKKQKLRFSTIGQL